MNTAYSKTKQEILKAIRGNKSQNYVNRKLGYTHNYFSKWENNSRNLRWIDFVRICEVCNKKDKLKSAIEALGISPTIEPSDHAEILRSLFGKKKINEIALETGISRFVISRWLKNKSYPSFEDILIIIKKLMGDHIRFILNIIEIDKQIPSLQAEYEQYLIQRNIFCDHPLASIINCYLYLSDYTDKTSKFVPGSIAKKFNFSPEEEKLIISLLIKGNIIEMKNGKYEFCNTKSNLDTSGDYIKGLKYKRYWLTKALSLLNKLIDRNEVSTESRFGYTFLSVSKNGYEKVMERTRQYLADIANMEDKGKLEKIIMTNIQLLDIHELGDKAILIEK